MDHDSRLDRIESAMAALLERLDAGPVRWFDIERAARYGSLSTKTIRRMISTGKLTPRRPVRGKILIDRVELDALISGATSTPRNGRGRFLAAEAADRAKRRAGN